MVKEDIDLVTVAKSSQKKSLLERYDMPIENLSYEYITQCTRVKELERIVLILRSGEEGIYPDLTKHAEDRLAVVEPQSAVLRVAAPVLTKDMLAPEKRKRLENDINEWMNEMKMREKDLEEGRATLINEPNSQVADIRQIQLSASKKKKQQSSAVQREHKRISGCDYAAWDKYDADTEINRIDLQTERKQAEAKRSRRKIRDKEERMKKASREATIDKRTLTGTELAVLAEQEREKGNEAFKAGDYEEALQFYDSSISIDATINGYNNRAITCVKLRRYNEAVKDCNIVISMDHENIKALLRRGLAFEHLEKKADALADYEAVLKLEPTNKVAIAALNKLRQPCGSKKIRMKIEERAETDKPDNVPLDQSGSEKLKRDSRASGTLQRSTNLSQRKSLSVGPSESLGPINRAIARPQVCFCNNAPSSSQHSSPLPHARNAYCSGTVDRSLVDAKSRGIFADTKIFANKSSVVIEEIPNDEQSAAPVEKFAIQRSKFTATNLERSNGTLTTFGVGDGEEIGKRSVEIVGETGKKSVKIVEEFGERTAEILEEKSTRHSENSERMSNSNSTEDNEGNLPDGNSSSDVGTGDNENIAIAARVIANEARSKNNSNTELSNVKKFDRIESPYEFLRLWHSLKNDPDLIDHETLLRALAPDDIDTGNKLDGGMLSTILRCLERRFSAAEDATFLYRFLRCLARVQRFSLVRMFMDANDRKVLKGIFSMLEAQKSRNDIEDLRKTYELSL